MVFNFGIAALAWVVIWLIRHIKECLDSQNLHFISNSSCLMRCKIVHEDSDAFEKVGISKIDKVLNELLLVYRFIENLMVFETIFL